MDALKLLTVVFAMFSVLDAAAVPCKWAQYRLKYLTEESIELLLSMSDPMPLKCLEKREELEVGFPEDAFQEAQNIDIAVVALKTLRGVGRVFKNDQTSVTWNLEKLRLFKHIVSSRLIENLQKCVREDASQKADSSLGKLRSFFDQLEDQLREKELSECAWEIAREEVKRSLVKFHEVLMSRS
ncbi:hypothetical protein P4O66_018959 [Electrophorus voltai]|uniref:Uncharacterized protein n=1 Tax=Electrophorus voltai TaxID=2609070 RepID=A0AAD8YQX2_9TELE|nr:interferon tau-11-like [Electrophorus electricus]KAK1785592.1 hypothetical protein P4O66_018959 [Electrophorus voltai]